MYITALRLLGVGTLLSLLPGGWGKQCNTIDQCMCLFDDGSGTVDLTTAGNSDGTPKYKDYTALYDSYLYSYNPCYAFSQNTCTDVAMCQSDYAGSSWVTGTQDTAAWSYDGTNIQIYYYAETDTMRETFITAICDETYTEPFVEIQGEDPVGTPQYHGRITTKCACADGCHTTDGPGFNIEVTIGGGWILVIIFLSVSFVYLVGGVLIQKFGRHQSGAEIIPNVSFWSALPGLIKDGFAFTIGLCRGGRGGGGMASSGGKLYQSI